MTTVPPTRGFAPPVGTFAAEHLSPSYPERAARGTADKLRAWQAEALDAYFAREPRDFLAAATPGAARSRAETTRRDINLGDMLDMLGHASLSDAERSRKMRARRMLLIALLCRSAPHA